MGGGGGWVGSARQTSRRTGLRTDRRRLPRGKLRGPRTTVFCLTSDSQSFVQYFKDRVGASGTYIVLLYPDCSEDGGVKQDTTALEYRKSGVRQAASGKPSEDGGVKQDTLDRQRSDSFRVF